MLSLNRTNILIILKNVNFDVMSKGWNVFLNVYEALRFILEIFGLIKSKKDNNGK